MTFEGPSARKAAPAVPSDSGPARGAYQGGSAGETVPWGGGGMPAAPRDRPGRDNLRGGLGRGAMGVVYRALDPQLDRTVAIKALRPDLGLAPELHGELTRRFYQEAVAAGRG